jgi:hypothetical protein
VIERLAVEEHLEPTAVHPSGRQPLDAARRLDVCDALRQQRGWPHLGAGAGAGRLARRIDGVAVQRQPRLCGEDGPDLLHMLSDDGERFSRETNSLGRRRGCQSAGKQRAGAQRDRCEHASGRPRCRQCALASSPCCHGGVLSSGSPVLRSNRPGRLHGRPGDAKGQGAHRKDLRRAPSRAPPP